MARNKKSENLKVIQGTDRRDRNKSVNLGSTELPTPPDSMTTAGEKVFEQLVSRLTELKTIHWTDDLSLAVAAESYVTYMKCCKVLSEKGETYTFTNSRGELSIKQRPELKIANDAFNRYFAIAKSYGLTAQSRVNLNISLPDPNKKPKESKWAKFVK